MELQNIFLLFFIIFFMAIFSILGLYFVIFYSHRNEKTFQGYLFFQVVAIFGFVYPMLILMIPVIDFLFNKTNHTQMNGGLESLDDIYLVSSKVPLFLYTGLFLYFFNLFAIEYYRSDKKVLKTRIFLSLKRPAFSMLLYFLSGLFFFALGQVSPYQINIDNSEFTTSAGTENINKDQKISYLIKMRLKLELFQAFLIPLIFLGSFYFVSYVGSMMAFYPQQLIMGFVNRARVPTAERLVLAKQALKQKSSYLLDKGRESYNKNRDFLMLQQSGGEAVKNQKLKVVQAEFHEIRQEYFQFKEFYEQYQKENNILDQNPLTDLGKFILGIIFYIVGLIFLLQCLQNLEGSHSIIRKIFIFFNYFGFVHGTVYYIFLAVYVFWGTYQTIFTYKRFYSSQTNFQPLMINQTWMDTFFENNNIILMCSIGFMVFMVIAINRLWGLTFLYPLFADILTQARVQKIFYNFKIQEFLFIAFFLISLFTGFFSKTGSVLVDEEVYQKQQEFEEEKEKLKESQINQCQYFKKFNQYCKCLQIQKP